jgi:V-type H+-transporting ATPase subunit C
LPHFSSNQYQRSDFRTSGNLSNKSLTTIVDPSLIIQDSEYLETHLIAVPNTITKDFIKSYETICGMIVPRSAVRIDADDEFTLYAVTTFKKTSAEFVHKSRELKWTPRDYKYKEGGKEEEQKEVEKVGKDERKVWNEAFRLARTAWGEAVMAWVHVLALRVFVETVLRYGLPLSFVCGLVRVCRVLPAAPRSTSHLQE